MSYYLEYGLTRPLLFPPAERTGGFRVLGPILWYLLRFLPPLLLLARLPTLRTVEDGRPRQIIRIYNFSHKMMSASYIRTIS